MIILLIILIVGIIIGFVLASGIGIYFIRVDEPIIDPLKEQNEKIQNKK